MFNVFQGRNFASNCFIPETRYKFTPKGVATQLAPFLVLTYTYFTVYGRIKKVRAVNAQTNLA